MASQARASLDAGRLGEAELQARRILALSGDEPAAPRAEALEILARVRMAEERPRVDEAEGLLDDATAIWQELGRDDRVAETVLLACRDVIAPAGQLERALARLEALESTDPLVPGSAAVALCRAEIHFTLGDLGQAEDQLDLILGEELGPIAEEDVADAALLAASVAALTDRSLDAVTLVRRAERAATGAAPEGRAALHARAADILDTAGEADLAWEHLQRATELVDGRPTRPVVLAELAVHARHGDPGRAEEAAVALRRFPPASSTEEWQLLLLRALAAHRRRDHRAGRLAARAFEEAAALGRPELPLVREPQVARQLLELATASGSAAAASLPRPQPTAHVRLFGTFAVERAGVPVALNDQAALIVKLLACAGGRLHRDEVAESLWPGSEPGRGRQRLRNALTRLRRADAGLVVRDGEVLRFGSNVSVDAYAFDREARRALVAGAAEEPHAAALARAAVVLYEDELLPFDRYHDWADGPRERLRRLYLSLLDLLVRRACDRGDLDEAAELAHLGLEAEPHAEERYLTAARLHLERGCRGRALAVLHDARRLADDLSLPVSAEHRAIEASIRADEVRDAQPAGIRIARAHRAIARPTG